MSPAPTQTFTPAQVESHNTEDSCWVVHKNKIYDVTSFVQDHPGGEDYILDHAGQDVTKLMQDELQHLHSEGAYEMLDEFFVGSLDPSSVAQTSSPVKDTGLHKRGSTDLNEKETEAYFKPTDIAADNKNKFLDLSQPLMWQLWNSTYTKAFYLEQVHIPRHLSGPARIFGSPYLEVFTKTPWYMIPIFWLPIIAYNANRSVQEGLRTEQVAVLFVGGIFLWTLAEYVIHRFLFHLDDYLPNNTFWQVAHFLLHGIHHYLPMDRLRLVMPPALAVALAIPINKLIHSALPYAQAYAVFSGLLLGYVLYDMTHYYLHHAKVFKIHFREMKTYHLAHHYKNFEGGYGITSKIWDKVFNTELQL
ncbi:fatty acid alpha-hydroxylase [Podila verticillata]|nr:fatty acid alpha-hydroxylase [Podila verticillata]